MQGHPHKATVAPEQQRAPKLLIVQLLWTAVGFLRKQPTIY